MLALAPLRQPWWQKPQLMQAWRRGPPSEWKSRGDDGGRARPPSGCRARRRHRAMICAGPFRGTGRQRIAAAGIPRIASAPPRPRGTARPARRTAPARRRSRGQSAPSPVSVRSRRSRASARGTKAPQCSVEPPTPVPLLFAPNASGRRAAAQALLGPVDLVGQGLVEGEALRREIRPCLQGHDLQAGRGEARQQRRAARAGSDHDRVDGVVVAVGPHPPEVHRPAPSAAPGLPGLGVVETDRVEARQARRRSPPADRRRRRCRRNRSAPAQPDGRARAAPRRRAGLRTRTASGPHPAGRRADSGTARCARSAEGQQGVLILCVEARKGGPARRGPPHPGCAGRRGKPPRSGGRAEKRHPSPAPEARRRSRRAARSRSGTGRTRAKTARRIASSTGSSASGA